VIDGNNVYFVSTSPQRDVVFKLDTSTGVTSVVAELGRGFELSSDFEMSPNGTIVTFDRDGNRIIEIDPVSGSTSVLVDADELRSVIGISSEAEFSIDGLGFDGSGNLIFGERSTAQIYCFTSNEAGEIDPATGHVLVSSDQLLQIQDTDVDLYGDGDVLHLLDGPTTNNTFDGAQGDDLLLSGAGDDTLYGGEGNDTIFAGAGDDWIVGGNGADLLSGGTGSDTFVFEGASEYGDSIQDFESGSDKIILNLEELMGDKQIEETTEGFTIIGGDTTVEYSAVEDALRVNDGQGYVTVATFENDATIDPDDIDFS